MKCSRCQHENPADAVFCQECGTRLELACPGCGTANQIVAKFCKKCGQPIAMTPPMLGCVGLGRGKSNRRAATLEEAIANAPRKNRVSEPFWTTWLGDAYLAANSIADARRVATAALNLARDRQLRGDEAHALRLVAEIAVLQGPSDLKTAEALYHDAKTLADERGMRPLVAHCHAGLAKLYRRTAKRREADEHITIATTMYREMGMTYWLEKTETEMAQPG